MALNWSKLFGGRSRRGGRAGQRPRGRRFAPQVEGLEGRWMPAVDVILEWNDVMLEANANDHSLAKPEQGGPVLTGRAFAIVSAAMYDAYNSVEHIGAAYLVTAPNAHHADEDAAVAQAAHDTLVALFPSQTALFDQKLQEALARIPNGTGESQGQAVGAYVARRILAARADDGSADLSSPPYIPNGQPGFHSPDPLHPDQGHYGPGGGNITPFAVENSDQFGARRLDDGTPAGRMAFMQSKEYTDAFKEVSGLGGDGVTSRTRRTAEQTRIGIFWGYDGRPGLGTPPRMYNQIARTVAAQKHNTEAENARLFGLLNIAMADAGFTSWDDKYENKFWRPVMAVRAADLDGNPKTDVDPNWTPLGAQASNPRPGETNFTPPFPAYTSGHATFGAAAFQTLSRFYGRDDISFSFTSDEFNGVTKGVDGNVRPVVTRTFDSFTEAKVENAQSRIYLGIHWRFDADDGIKSGDGVANYVFDHFLQPTGHGLQHNLLAGGSGSGGDRVLGTQDSAGDARGAGAANQFFAAPSNGTLFRADSSAPAASPPRLAPTVGGVTEADVGAATGETLPRLEGQTTTAFRVLSSPDPLDPGDVLGGL